MSGNKETRINVPTWRQSDFNAAIPIKKRRYFVQPQQLPPMEEEQAQPLEKSPQSNEKGDTSVGMSSGGNLKLMGGYLKSFGGQVSVGNSEIAARSGGNNVVDQIRVKVEETNFPIQSSPLEIPSSSVGKLPVGSGHAHSSVEKTVVKTNDIERETCGTENLRGKCQTEAFSGEDTLSRRLGYITKITSSQYRENDETSSLNLSLSKDVSVPCTNTGSISVCGNISGVNRSNWDLNTTMDAWEDSIDRKTKVSTTGAFVNSNLSLHDKETLSSKSVSEKQKENDHQVNPTCSLSLGLSSYPSIEKTPLLPTTTSEVRAARTSFTRPVMMAGKTVKSEFIEESVRQTTETAQVSPIGLSIKRVTENPQVLPIRLSIERVKQEVVGRISQECTPSATVLKPVAPISVKTEPNNFTQSEVFTRNASILQPNKVLDLPTSSTPNQIPCSYGISNYTPMSLNGTTVSTLNDNSAQSNRAASGNLYEVLKHGMTYSGNASGANVTSLTEEKTLDGSRTCILKDLPCNSRGTDNDKETDEKLDSYGFESDLSRVGKKEIGKRIQYDAGKAAEYGGSETEQSGFIKIPFLGNYQNSNHVEGKGTSPALAGNKHLKECPPELQNGIEGRIVQDGEGTSGVSTVSGENVENPEMVDNSSPFSYKADVRDPPAEFSEGSQRRIINLAQVSNKDGSGSFVPLRMERERLRDFEFEPRRYLSRRSDESYKFPRERYRGKFTRFNSYMPDRRRYSDKIENEEDTKIFEFDNHGNNRRSGFNFNNRGRRTTDDEAMPFPRSFRGRSSNYSFNHRGKTSDDDSSAFNGFRDGKRFQREQSDKGEPTFTGTLRSYQSQNDSFARERTQFSKRSFSGYRSQSPARSRERSNGPSSSSYRNRSQEEFSEHSHRRSTERRISPDRPNYSREMVVRRHNSPPPYSHRPNAGRGRGYTRGRGYIRGRGTYIRGRGYGRDNYSFRNSSDRRYNGNMNNSDPRERVDYSDDFFEGQTHSEQYGVNVERRRFDYRHDDSTGSFRASFDNDGCVAPTNVENETDDAMRFGQDHDIENDGQGSSMDISQNSNENASERSKNMEEVEESSKPQ